MEAEKDMRVCTLSDQTRNQLIVVSLKEIQDKCFLGSGPEGDEVLKNTGDFRSFVLPFVCPPQALSGLKSAFSGLKSTLSGLKSALSGL